MRWLAALAAFSVLFSIGRAHAQEPAPETRDDDAARAATHAVTITIAGDPDPRPIEATLKDLFAHLPEAPSPPVSVDVTTVPEIEPRSITDPPAERPPAFARVWIDMRTDTCLVSIADAQWERIYLRRISRPAGRGDVTREQIAHIVVSAVEAMLAGGTIGVARAELNPPPPTTSPPPAPPSKPRAPEAPAPTPAARALRATAKLAIGYEALAFSTHTQAHGPWASVRGMLPDGPWSFGLELSAQWRAPLTVDAAPIGVRLDTKAFRLLLDVERSLSPRVALRAGVGPGFDFLAVEPRGLSHLTGGNGEPTITVEGNRSRVSPLIRWTLGVDVRLARSVHVGLAAVLDHDLLNRSYFVFQQGVPHDVLAPFALRPGLTLALAADLVPR